MKIIKVVLLITTASTSVLTIDQRYDPLSDEFINLINEKASTWQAGRNFVPSTSMSYIRGLMGLLPTPLENRLPAKQFNLNDKKLPSEFDARVQWKHCPTISDIRDQGGCTSGWAVSAVSAISDRICIHSSNTTNVYLSAQDVVSCSDHGFLGCKGGNSNRAWIFWLENGIVSGGPYGSNIGCRPYEIAPCQHYVNGSRPPCHHENTPPCKNTCERSYEIEYLSDKHFASSAYRVSEVAIQREIYENGPVSAVMGVYEDFLHYKSGVYRHEIDNFVGGHAVRILGWGTDNNVVPYWLAANSWNTDWGDKGYFKILRGQNECGIEDDVTAGMPRA